MTAATEALKNAFRDFVTSGVPASGANEPSKSEIRSALDMLASELASATSGILRYATKALLNADSSQADGTLAYVFANNGAADDPENGIYQWNANDNAWEPASWYFESVAAVVQPLVDAAEAAAEQAVESAAQLGSLTENAQILPVVEGPIEVLTDEDGRVVRASYPSGRLRTAHFDTGELFNPRAPLLGPHGDTSPVDLNHFLSWGQSQELAGNNAFNSARVDPRDLTFSSGIITTGANTSVFAPMPILGNAQIQWSAMAQLKFMIAADHGFANDYRIFASTSAQNGAKIDEIDKGTAAYALLMNQIFEASRIADSLGYVHRVQAFCGFQGNADFATDPAVYRASLVQLMADLRADIRARTGQVTDDLPFIFIQDADEQTDYAPGVEYEPSAAAVYYDLAKEGLLYVSSSAYHVPYSDDRHFIADGYMHLGQHRGRALYEIVYRGGTWTGLRPREVLRYRSDKILVRFHVPVPPLHFDTVTVTDPGAYGFRYRDDDGEAEITAVSIVGQQQVDVLITLERSMGANPELSYAWYALGGDDSGPLTGPRGCLFDSDWTKPYQGGWNLNNACLRFKEAVL